MLLELAETKEFELRELCETELRLEGLWELRDCELREDDEAVPQVDWDCVERVELLLSVLAVLTVLRELLELEELFELFVLFVDPVLLELLGEDELEDW